MTSSIAPARGRKSASPRSKRSSAREQSSTPTHSEPLASTAPTESSNKRFKLKLGENVKKSHGYPFPGVVVARFRNSKGHERYVIEATGRNYTGMLHIFGPHQLELIP